MGPERHQPSSRPLHQGERERFLGLTEGCQTCIGWVLKFTLPRIRGPSRVHMLR